MTLNISPSSTAQCKAYINQLLRIEYLQDSDFSQAATILFSLFAKLFKSEMEILWNRFCVEYERESCMQGPFPFREKSRFLWILFSLSTIFSSFFIGLSIITMVFDPCSTVNYFENYHQPLLCPKMSLLEFFSKSVKKD